MPIEKIITTTEAHPASGRANTPNANTQIHLPSINTLLSRPESPISRQELERRLKPSIQKLLREAAKSQSLLGKTIPLMPRMDLYMAPEGATATFELAGLSSDQVHVNVSNRVLTVSATRHRPMPVRMKPPQTSPSPAPTLSTTSPSPKQADRPLPTSTAPAAVPIGYWISERRHGHISRSIRLPGWVRLEDIRARMQHGVLTIVFPRSKEEQVDAHAMVIDVQ